MKILSSTLFRGAAFSAALLVSAMASRGQGATGTISSSQLSANLWQYTITLTDTGSTTLDGLWYAWTPNVSPFFYLPSGTLSAISGQNGWTGAIVGSSIQFSAGTAISTGQSVQLTYDATFSPTTLASTANSGLSVAYEGAIDASPGTPDFTITQATPEPTSLALFGTAIAGLAAVRRRLKK
jgi:hypothetical protein